MERTIGMFLATAMLYALPSLVAAVRWPWETRNQRASAALAALLATLITAMAWGVDAVRAAKVNTWMGSCLVVLPILILVVLARGAPFLTMRDDLASQKSIRLTRMAWCSTGLFLLAMLVAMKTVFDRLPA